MWEGMRQSRVFKKPWGGRGRRENGRLFVIWKVLEPVDKHGDQGGGRGKGAGAHSSAVRLD